MYSAIDTTAMTIVETVGVRYLGCIFANALGRALYAAMDRVVRAVGRIVVWVDAAADDSTMRISSRARKVPKPLVPKMALPWTESTSNGVRVLQAAARRPDVREGQHREDDQRVGHEQQHRRDDRRPAGVLALSAVSSLTATAVSQPQ